MVVRVNFKSNRIAKSRIMTEFQEAVTGITNCSLNDKRCQHDAMFSLAPQLLIKDKLFKKDKK